MNYMVGCTVLTDSRLRGKSKCLRYNRVPSALVPMDNSHQVTPALGQSSSDDTTLNEFVVLFALQVHFTHLNWHFLCMQHRNRG